MKVRIRKAGATFHLIHATTGERIDGINEPTYQHAARVARRLSYVIAPRGIEKHFFVPCLSEPLTRVDCSSGLTFWLDGHCSGQVVKSAADDTGMYSHLMPCPVGQVAIFNGQF